MTTPTTPTPTTWADALATAIEQLDAKTALPVMASLYVSPAEQRLLDLRQLLNFTEGAFGDVNADFYELRVSIERMAGFLTGGYTTAAAVSALRERIRFQVADRVRQYVESAALLDGLLADHDLADLIQADDLAGFQAAVAEVLK